MAISTDGAEDAGQMATHSGSAFPVLPDPEGRVVRQYGVYDLLGDGVSAPATFIVDDERVIRWRHVGKDAADRPPSGQTINVLRSIGK